jgi:hypothetical protein
MVALRQDGAPTSSGHAPGPAVRTRASRRLKVVAVPAHGFPRVQASALVDGADFRDTGCEFAPSCLRCPFARCKEDDPAAFQRLDAARRDREIARLRRDHGAPIDMLARAYGLSRRSIFRVLREQGGGRGSTGRGTARVRPARSTRL